MILLGLSSPVYLTNRNRSFSAENLTFILENYMQPANFKILGHLEGTSL